MYIELFLNFLKIGLFTFGGGYAMLSFIENVCVKNKKWITHEEMVQITVLAESTPGPVAVNCSTYVGYKQKGLFGAFCATLGMVIPSFVIIYVISMFLDGFMQNTYVAKTFAGIQIAVGLFILDAGISLLKKMKKNTLAIVILIAGCLAMLVIDFFAIDFSSIALLLISAAVSLTVAWISQMVRKQGGEKK